MLHFITALFAGIVGIFVALVGIGIGIGALLLAMAPFLILLMIPLLPVLLLVWILRRIGILSGPFLTFVVIVAGLFLMIGGVRNMWSSRSQSLSEWVETKKEELQACQEQGGNNVTVEWDDDDLVFTCRGKAKTSQPAKDAHI